MDIMDRNKMFSLIESMDETTQSMEEIVGDSGDEDMEICLQQIVGAVREIEWFLNAEILKQSMRILDK